MPYASKWTTLPRRATIVDHPSDLLLINKFLYGRGDTLEFFRRQSHRARVSRPAGVACMLLVLCLRHYLTLPVVVIFIYVGKYFGRCGWKPHLRDWINTGSVRNTNLPQCINNTISLKCKCIDSVDKVKEFEWSEVRSLVSAQAGGARGSLSHSLSDRLIPAYVEGKRYNTDIICTVIQEKWYNNSR